jgi:hypothetical protein
MELPPKLMSREAAIKEAQRIANENGEYMLVLFDTSCTETLSSSEDAFFPATLRQWRDFDKNREWMLGTGVPPIRKP